MLFAAMPQEGAAAPAELPHYDCFRTSGPITIDGRLDEGTWSAVPTFPLVLWNGAGKPKRSTTVQAAWDEANLYLAYRIQDDSILCTMRERDAPLWNEEVVEFFVDPGGKLDAYFEIEWNALGAVVDLVIIHAPINPANGPGALAWDARGMRHAVLVDGEIGEGRKAKGWQVEIALPLNLMVHSRNTPPKDGDTWRANFFRIERSDPEVEYTCWSPVLGKTVSYHRPERFGYLRFRDTTA